MKINRYFPVFNVVLVIYHYVERIWRILITPDFLYNIYYNFGGRDICNTDGKISKYLYCELSPVEELL